jgi:hypothetical protein
LQEAKQIGDSRRSLALARRSKSHFEDNKERMRYPKFREQGLFVGSGVIEAGCKTQLSAWWEIRELLGHLSASKQGL